MPNGYGPYLDDVSCFRCRYCRVTAFSVANFAWLNLAADVRWVDDTAIAERTINPCLLRSMARQPSLASRAHASLQSLVTGLSGAEAGEERNRIIAWIHQGAPMECFAAVAPIFKNNCAVCHNPQYNRSIPNLTSYNEIKKLVHTDTGEDIVQLARVSHIHLFGISLIFIATGTIFALSGTPAWFRAVVVAVPYLTIIMDIGSWWLTKYLSPTFAWIVFGGGAAMGAALALQILIPLWEMWADPVTKGLARVSRILQPRQMGSPHS